MAPLLHITNGDSVIFGFREAGLEGDYLSWLDLLYEGPVPSVSFDELSSIRSRHIADLAWATYETAKAQFAARDQKLKSFRSYKEVILWFEHDLTDQLQLIQLLDWFAGQDLSDTRLSLININAYPGVVPFYGLGMLNGQQLLKLLPDRKTVTPQQFSSGRAAWKMFCAAEPSLLLALIKADLPGLPFLKSAVLRFLEEYPSAHNGLSRTEQQILLAVADGKKERGEMFLATQERESTPFMGDSSTYLRLDRLAAGHKPALEKSAVGTYSITQFGRGLLASKADWIRHNGIDLWFGGVHLQSDRHTKDSPWRWDREQQTLIAQPKHPNLNRRS